MLQLLDVDGVDLFVAELLRQQVRQARPQPLRRALRIIVEALAVLAAQAGVLLDQILEQLLLPRIDGVLAEVGFGGAQDFQAEIDRGLVVERQRPDRHAGHARGILDHCRGNSFQQHQMAFLDVSEHAAVGVEASGVIHDNGRLPDGAHVIERDGQRAVAGLLAENDLDQHHAVDRREEVDADEARLVLELGRQRRDRQRRGVGGKDRLVADHGLHLGDDVGLDLAVLEHRFDDQVAIGQRRVVRGRRDEGEEFVARRALHAALHDAVRQRLVQRRLALLGRLLVAIDQHHLQAGGGADLRDAGAHEAGADDADLLEVRRRLLGGTPRAFVEVLHRHEQRADHRRRFRRAHDLCEPARLDPQRRVHVDLQAFVDDLQNGASRRVIVIGLAAIDRVGRRERHHAGLGVDRAAGQLEALLVPRLDRFAAGLDPFLRRLDEIGSGHHRVDQLRGFGAIDRELISLEQKLQRVGRLHHARDALRAAGAGEKADLDFGQTDARLGIFRRDALMTGERQLEAAAHRGAVEGADPRLARRLDAPVQQRQLAAFLEHETGRGFRAFVLHHVGVHRAHALQHRQVGAAAEGVLAGGDDRALDRFIGRDFLDDRREFADHVHRDDVHRAAGRVPGDERNAIGIDVEGEVSHNFQLLWRKRIAVFLGVTEAFVVSDDHHVDVGIMRALGRGTTSHLDKHRVSARTVDQTMPIGDAGAPGGRVAGPQHGLTVVLAQHHFAFEHIDQFVFVLVPMALRRCRAGFEGADIDAELRQSGGAGESLAPPAFHRLVVRRRIVGRGIDHNFIYIYFRHSWSLRPVR